MSDRSCVGFPKDCVNHDILLSTLKFYGVTGKTFSLIKSFLEDRHQRVIYMPIIIPILNVQK